MKTAMNNVLLPTLFNVVNNIDSIHTQQKMNNLFWPDENSYEQCLAAHIVQCCQQYCSTLLHLIEG